MTSFPNGSLHDTEVFYIHVQWQHFLEASHFLIYAESTYTQKGTLTILSLLLLQLYCHEEKKYSQQEKGGIFFISSRPGKVRHTVRIKSIGMLWL